jgi:Ser/Thr protein kinase RdoA (MazF antagonist)
VTTEGLSAHLERQYGIRIARLTTLDGGVFRVDRHDGPSWVARAFPAARPVERVDGDATVLRYVEEHGFPAERCAHTEPVSAFDGQGVLVTEFVEGAIADGRVATLQQLGELLGRLQSLPEVPGAVAREAGALHHWAPNGGGPVQDLAAAESWLTAVESCVPVPHHALYDSLREAVGRTDDGRDLPRAFVHPDFHRGNVVASPGSDLVVIDWADAGWGPRVASLAMLLFTAVAKQYPGDPVGGPDLTRVDPVVNGYRAHVHLDPDELAGLDDALRRPPLVLACFLFCGAVKASGTPPTASPWWPKYDLAEAIAQRARESFER